MIKVPMTPESSWSPPRILLEDELKEKLTDANYIIHKPQGGGKPPAPPGDSLKNVPNKSNG